MSTLLWVEDFEGKSDQYRRTTSDVFGNAISIKASDIPNEVNELRDCLRAQQVILATNFAEAARVIDERLPDVDGVVLDIDLELIGERGDENFDNDSRLVKGILERWHKYEPGADDENASYDKAQKSMKLIAGYHLYVDLVINRGFPRDRILFCSQHGDQLDKALAGSFDRAYLERPDVLRKADPRVGEWVSGVRDDPYSKLRRWIILSCREMLTRLMHRQTSFGLPGLSGVETEQLTPDDGKNLLNTLQMMMPARISSDQNLKNILRLFVRTLTQDWDKVDYKNPKLPNATKAFAAVLKLTRNWTSHNSEALTNLTEADVAFLFLIALHACFEMKGSLPNEFDSPLLALIGGKSELDMAQMKQDYEATYKEITERWQELPDAQRGYTDKEGRFRESITFSDRTNDLEKTKKLESGEHEILLRQIFWHQLHWPQPEFKPEKRFFTRGNFLPQLTSCLYRKGFA